MSGRWSLLAVMIAFGVVAATVRSQPAGDGPGPQATAGRVVAVTLYRGQAQVTREVGVPRGRDGVELVVGPLPVQVVPDSLFAEGGPGVQVRAVRHRRRAVGQEPREQVSQIDLQIEQVQAQQRAAAENLERVQKNRQSLQQLDALIGPSAARDAEAGKLVIDAETITRLTSFAFEQRQRMTNEHLELQARQRELQKQLEQLQRERHQIASDTAHFEHEAVLFLVRDADAGGAEATVRLTYLVNGCGWSPAYNVRAEAGGQQAQVEFNALIQQMSGEDWRDVRLTLSTATPALSAAAPALGAFHVGLTPLRAAEFNLNEALSNTNAGGYVQAQQLRQQAQLEGRQAVRFDDNLLNSWRMNVAGNDLQLLEQVLSPAEFARMRLTMSEGGDAPSLTYELADRISLASRADQQLVRVAAVDMPASFHQVAMPVLTSFVYREVELSNNSDTDLLGGVVSAYYDGRFVGRTEIPTVARGQTFVVGFGADPQLRAEKQLVERTESVQDGNRVVSFAYRLSIENF